MNRCFEVSYFGMDQLHHQETHTLDPEALDDLIADLEGRGAQMICVETDGRPVYEDGAFMSYFIQDKKKPLRRGVTGFCWVRPPASWPGPPRWNHPPG